MALPPSLSFPVKRLIIVAVCLLALVSAPGAEENTETLTRAGYLVANSEGRILHQLHSDELYVPASTVKLLTAYLCLQHWGEQHRFATTFFFEQTSATLWVRAGGDPFIVSEEIELMADALASTGITSVNSIGLDASLFGKDLVVPGASTTDNPYDAIPTAIGANFNTINVMKKSGVVLSAESQTSLTPIAMKIGEALQEGEKKRVNLGRSSARAERYFAELLAWALRVRNVPVGNTVVWGNVPVSAPLYVHRNSRTLGEVIQGMLKYSTNFIANHLLLTLVAEKTSLPANFARVQSYLSGELTQRFGWSSFSLLEGAGLSPDNRLSAEQLVSVAQRFVPWKHLLPEIASGVVAKTGTLTDVKTLVGYVAADQDQWHAFAVLVNQPVNPEVPLQIIQSLD
ncbi:MAG: D-alanyl-D-alanine carboxypeptidase [Pseudomonadota bacterium]